MVPYAQHSVTSYNNGQLHVERSMNSLPSYGVPGSGHKPYLLPKPTAPAKENLGAVTVNSIPNKVAVGENPKQIVANSKLSQSAKKGAPKGVNPQFIDPPEEFQFLSTKCSR